MEKRLLDWTEQEFMQFGHRNQLSRHYLHETPAFDEAALIEILDRHPRELLGIFTMGSDPTKIHEWRLVEPGDATGQEIYDAVRRGRIFLNTLFTERSSDPIASLMQQVFTELRERSPAMRYAHDASATLILSSPGIQVYYHMDVEPNILWHIRGRKRAWVYPALDFRIVDQQQLEAIFAGEAEHEDLPFDPAWDSLGTCFELKPGDVLSWPLSSPHRVLNDTMNVTLSTNYSTPESRRRIAIQTANRRLLRPLGIRRPSAAERGLRATVKCAALALSNRLRRQAHQARPPRMAELRLDPNAESGWAPLDRPIEASFR
ncbi:MAG TPA: hypothetical protein ENK16_04955 [Chromatiales bacterium]|nr:hypothetical protein [Chromatiales bacterium]